MTMYSTVELA